MCPESDSLETEVLDQAPSFYERLRELIVLLGFTELAWIAFWLVRPDQATPAFRAIVVVWIIAMLVWTGFVIKLGTAGFFLRHTQHLSNLIGVALVLGLAAVAFGSTATAREGLLFAAGRTTDSQFAAIHILRLLAIGGVIKCLKGELPRHFLVLAALPDFLFGLSAVAVTVVAGSGGVSHDLLVAWHVIGLSVFMSTGAAMFLSVPSPLRVFHGRPDASLVFQFPMLLAPNLTVSLFMFAHAIALVKLAFT